MPEEDIKVGAEGPEEGKKKSGLIKLIIIGVGALLILGGGGFAAYKFFFAKPDAPPAAEGKAEAGKEEKKDDKKKEGEKATPPMSLEPFIVNLADPGGKRYLKLTVSLDIKDEKLKKELETRMPQIRDSVLLLLSSKTFNDISPVAGKIKLRNEVLKIVNNTLGGAGQVHALYFGEFVIQ
ncbi:MAG: flagellar basal body-associated FliL family protein [Desulfarculus sp.]|nr:flagellar basal body-associated FliL family protein [Desulfarculus sp.]